jgi:hypothetical protein
MVIGAKQVLPSEYQDRVRIIDPVTKHEVDTAMDSFLDQQQNPSATLFAPTAITKTNVRCDTETPQNADDDDTTAPSRIRRRTQKTSKKQNKPGACRVVVGCCCVV